MLQNVEAEKVLYKRCADAGGVVCRVNNEFNLPSCLDMSYELKMWCCHFLEGYKGQIQSLLGLYRGF